MSNMSPFGSYSGLFEGFGATKLDYLEAIQASAANAAEGGTPDFADDIPGDTSTPFTLEIGASATGEIEVEGDEDWFAVQLEAGQSYRFTLTGNSLLDPLMSLHDNAGNQIAQNDDSNGLNSAINFTATTTGTYYVSASSFTGNTGNDVGTYTVAASELEPVTEVRTIDGIANFLTDEYGPREAFLEDTITYNVESLTAGAQLLAIRALDAWAEITNLTFIRNFDADFENSGAMIIFDDDDGDASSSSAFARTTNSGTLSDGTSRIVSAEINIDSNWFGGSTALDSYTYQTYLHEIGHALGLGHAGPYNGSARYGLDNVYVNDSWAFTVMSYFDQAESGYGDYRFVLGPAIADIVAIQDLYGTNPDGTRAGDTTYGFNSTEDDVNDWSQFVSTSGVRPPSMSIYDTGGIDTIDLSGFSSDQRLDLNAETFSDLGDRGAGDSYSGVISIARDTVIENAVGGSGNDTIIANSADNVLTGGTGADVFEFLAGSGSDTITDFNIAEDKIDVSSLSRNQFETMLASVQQDDEGAVLAMPEGGTLRLSGVSAADVTEAIFIAPDAPELNIINATQDKETLSGTTAADAFTFAPGTSTLANIDTVQNWQPGDTIDLSALGLTEADIEVRTLSGGAVIKLIEGFGADDFQLRIEVGSNSIQDILDSIVFDGTTPPPQNTTPDAVDDAFGVETGDSVSFDVLANDSDADGDALTVTSFTQPASGTLIQDDNGQFTYTPATGPVDGTESFTYTIDDGNGGTDTATATISITTSPPPSDYNVITGTPSRDILVGTSADDAFTFAPDTSTATQVDIVRDWQPGDVIDLSALGLTAADIETRLISGGTTLKLIEGFGADDFQLKIELGGHSVQDVLDSIIYDGTPPPGNTAPVAADDTANVEAGSSVSIDVLANDTDQDGDALTVAGFTQGANGSVTDDGNGLFTYTPDAGFTGPADTFTYTIDDGNGGQDSATVTVSIGTAPSLNVINASVGSEILIGTSDADAFTFTQGTSVSSAIDIVRDWQPGDVIDLSALGLTEENIEVRSISGGTTLKLIEGFGADDFQLKIELGDASAQDVLDSIVYGNNQSLAAASSAPKSAPVMEEADGFDFSGLSKEASTTGMEDWRLQPTEGLASATAQLDLLPAPVFGGPDGNDWISDLDWYDMG